MEPLVKEWPPTGHSRFAILIRRMMRREWLWRDQPGSYRYEWRIGR